jgi:hypothetical protein
MKTIKLKQVKHSVKIGQETPTIEPNIKESCFLELDGKIIGFYLDHLPDKLEKLIAIANNELRSVRVPKSKMNRKVPDGKDEDTGLYKYKNEVTQYSTIIGSVPPKPHMKRPYPGISSVHGHESAGVFIKAMKLSALEAGEIIKSLMNEQYQNQIELIKENVPLKWRFTDLFTSSISNYNISAPYHRDTLNIEGTVNVIITKRKGSTGGDLNVPDYGATFDCKDNSMIVYPAWMNVHGVTPIIPHEKDGYRNSLVFYPLRAFKKH